MKARVDGNRLWSVVLVVLAFWMPIFMCHVTLGRFVPVYRELVPVWLVRSYYLLPGGVLAAIVVFGVLVLRNRGLPPASKIVWILALLTVPPLACPAYWWRHARDLQLPSARPKLQ